MILRTPKDVGAFVRQRRLELGLNQSALALRVGVSRQWIIEVEKGKPRAELGLILRTLQALELRLSARAFQQNAKQSAPLIDLDAIAQSARKPRP